MAGDVNLRRSQIARSPLMGCRATTELNTIDAAPLTLEGAVAAKGFSATRRSGDAEARSKARQQRAALGANLLVVGSPEQSTRS
jgi:hypothetical protein